MSEYVCSMYTMEYYSGSKKKEILTYVITWMNYVGT